MLWKSSPIELIEEYNKETKPEISFAYLKNFLKIAKKKLNSSN